MKVSNGCWVNKKGFEVKYASQPYEIETTENSITVLATPFVGRDRTNTILGPNLEITFSSTAENIIKVHVVHFKGGLDNSPHFELNEDNGFRPIIRETEKFAELISGNTKVVIRKGELWDIKYYYKDRYLTGASWRSTSYITESKYRARQEWKCRRMILSLNIRRMPVRPMREQLRMRFRRVYLWLWREVHAFRKEWTDCRYLDQRWRYLY